MLAALFFAASVDGYAQSGAGLEKPMNGFAVGFGGETNLNISERGKQKRLFVMRLGTKYSFELGNGVSFAPRTALAFLDGKTNFTYGVNIGLDF